jgi:hypothetical protein
MNMLQSWKAATNLLFMFTLELNTADKCIMLSREELSLYVTGFQIEHNGSF